jgi:hypothetical protein
MFDTIKETLGFGDNENAHPALKNFSRPLEKGKHVVMKTLKTALWTAAIFAVGAAILPGVLAGAMSAIGLGSFVTGGSILTAALGGAKVGAIIGGIIGLGKGVSGMDEAADAAEEQKMLSYSRNVQRAKSDAMFAAQMGQQMGGISPQALGFGQGQSQTRNMG